MYVVLGASGHTGGGVAKALLEKGKRVRVVGRDRAKLAALEKAGAEVFLGDVENAGAMREAFAGASAAYVLIPPNFVVEDFLGYQKRVVDAVGKAAEAAKLKHAALLSSAGANQTSGVGPIVGLGEMENRLAAVPGLSLLSLRAGFFMTNVLASVGLMKAQGINPAPMPGDAPMHFTFADDIGVYAAERLAKLDFTGRQVVNAYGPRPLTMNEAMAVLSKTVGKPIAFVQAPPEAAEQGMIQAGLKPQMAALYVEMYGGAALGKLNPEPGTPVVNLPTTFETFAAQVFAPVFQAA